MLLAMGALGDLEIVPEMRIMQEVQELGELGVTSLAFS
jgi:hypothetical protein